ncbi:MarC family protein [Synechococcus sp. EJ6-Ellesmere]|uniref:MarC family protein n=1 Tax=Synechococcus sp. EJ6-Ellesmere TaxID=2823734 RepID=UPI0020CBE4CB|nr:MarC family protein [Synechococcus sp. EJ6-Ellesmere]MCP9824068.1 MarC family protein [Synechococcus sp. EJ6-Ellesmere]
MPPPIIPHHFMVQFVTSMVALLNPLGDFALFLALTQGRSRAEQKSIGNQAAVAIGVIMLTSLWLGRAILGGIGISIGAFSIAGGIVLFGIGLGMLNSKSGDSSKTESNQGNIDAGRMKTSPAVVPLAIPISAGPGVITALLVASHSNEAGIPGLLALSVASVVMAGMMAVVFWYAPALGRLMGPSGMQITTQIMGLIVTAIASQMVLNGLKSAAPMFIPPS